MHIETHAADRHCWLMTSEDQILGLLQTALELDGAPRGNVQVLEPKSQTLKIVAQVGFDDRFLRHFESVRPFDSSACGRASGSGSVVTISDVQCEPGMEGHLAVVSANGVRSIKSVPILNDAGDIIGVLSTHHPEVRDEWERENTRHIAATLASLLADWRAAA